MAEYVHAYLVYGPDVDGTDKLDILRAFYELPKANFGKGLDEVVEGKEGPGFFLVDVEYGSPVVTLNLDPELPEHLPELPVNLLKLHELDFEPSKMGDQHVETAVADYIDCIVQLYELSCEQGVSPKYVIGADPNQVDAFRGRFGWTTEPTRDGIMNGAVEQLFWLQILPPAMVDDLGRERVLSAPAAIINELSDGAVLLVTTERPYPPGDPTTVGDYLGVRARQYLS